MDNAIPLCAVLLIVFSQFGLAAAVGPGAPSQLAPGATRSRLPTPDAPAQATAERLMRDVLHDDFAQATTPDRSLALARKLMETAADTRDDSAQSYVLYKTAGDVAISARDLRLAHLADRKLCSVFNLDPVVLNVERFESAAKAAKKSADFAMIANASGQWVDAQEFDGRTELWQRAVSVGTESARRSADLSSRPAGHARRWTRRRFRRHTWR